MGSMDEEAQQYPQNMISRSMPIGTIIERLVNHGCPNISSRLDLTHCNDRPYSRGGFGDVHQGTLLDGTKVALKCLRLYVNDNETNDKALKYAARELHTWSRCRHPNVVELLGLAEFRDQIAMVSPWMENGSVDRLNRSNNMIDRCRLCFEIAQGLAYLHDINIVHGDLKGGNVLLSNDGGVQLADFGNAVLAGSALLFTESSSTRSGFSVRWAAPERLLDEVPYSRQADIYSLGMTILEIISRQLPYAETKNEAAVMMTVLKPQHPKRPEDTIPVESKQGNTLWALLKTCWSRDPEDRPEASYVASVVEMIKSEDLVVEREPSTTAVSSQTDLPVPETRTNSSPLGSAQSSSASEKKQRLETREGWELQRKRPRSRMDEQLHTPIAHQHLITRATEMLDLVPPQKRQRIGYSSTEPTPKPKYGVDDITHLLSEMRKLGVGLSERAGLESLDQQVRDFQQKACGQLHKFGDSEDTTLLTKFEELVVIGTSLHLRLNELAELERLVARLQFLRELGALDDGNPTLDQVEERISRGLAGGVSPDHRVMAELTRKATPGREWKVRALSILVQRSATMEDLDQLIISAQEIPILPDILGKLEQALAKRREYASKIEACLNPPWGEEVLVDYAVGLAAAILEEVSFPAAEELYALSTEAWMREETCEKIMTRRFQAKGNATVFDKVRAMRDEDKSRFWAFRVPRFEEISSQLVAHDDWIGRLPWARPGVSALDLDSIVGDVTGDGNAEGVPPTNEACTCICVEPVVVGESAQDAEVEVGQCDHCLVRFHAKCIEGSSCPFCDNHHWNVLMGEPRAFALQQLNLQMQKACELTSHYSPEYRALEAILFDSGESALTKPIIRFIKRLGQQTSPKPASISQIRHFMRTLYRIQFEVSARPEIFSYGLSLAHLHRQIVMLPQTKPTMRQKPKFVFKSEMEPKALDNSRCLCSRARWRKRYVWCGECQSFYHNECIALSATDKVPNSFMCPLCLLKRGKSYGPADVRVTYHDDDPEENVKFVDVKACLDNYSWKVVRRALPPPVRKTITVELFLFIPDTNPNVEVPELHAAYPEAHGSISLVNGLSSAVTLD